MVSIYPLLKMKTLLLEYFLLPQRLLLPPQFFRNMIKSFRVKEKQAGILLTVALTSVILFFHFQDILLHLDSPRLLDPYRDGVKTYLNAAWHAKYGASTTWFEGMNYPYPEHIVAATELPGLAILMKWLTPVFPELPTYVFGITHLLLLLSILLCVVLIYLIFKELGLPIWYAIPAAIGITFLAPQHMRMVPHMGLAPVFVVPAVIYGLLLFERRQRWRTSFFLTAVVFISSMLHFYFFAITAIMISVYFLFSVLRQFSWQRLGRWALHYFIMVGLPLIFFISWMILSDQVTDRSPKPAGFFTYHAIWESIFLSKEMPLYQWINEKIIKIEKVDFEGWAYIGMVADLFILAVAVRWIGRKFKKPLFDFFTLENKNFYWPLLWTGIVIAFLSCSQPFATKGLEFLLDYTGPLRQFRSTGRFAWAFYFIINVVAFAGFYQWSKTWKRKPVAIGVLTACLALLFYEVYFFQKSQQNYRPDKLREAPNLMPGERFSEIETIDFGKYQAILPIPYFNIGSNNFFAAGQSMVIQQSLVLSFQTGLPVTGAMLTRSSRQQCFDQMQLVTEPYRHPAILKDYKNDKPLLMIYSYLSLPEELARYDHLLDESELLHKNRDWDLYEVALASFDRRIENRKAKIRADIAGDSLFPHGDFLSTDSVADFVFLDFDEKKSVKTYLGQGAFAGKAGEENLLFDGNLIFGKKDSTYHLLAWVYAGEDRFSDILFRVREENQEGQKMGEAQFGTSFQVKVFDPNGWVLVDCPFKLKSGGGHIQVFFTLKNDDREIFTDELLILPEGVDLYRRRDGELWWNNRNFQ